MKVTNTVSSGFLARINPQLNRLGYSPTPRGWCDVTRLDYQTRFMVVEPGMRLILEIGEAHVELAGGEGVLVRPGTWVRRWEAGERSGRRLWVRFDWDDSYALVSRSEPLQVYAPDKPDLSLLRSAPGWIPKALWERPLALPADFFDLFERLNTRFLAGEPADRASARGLWLELLLKILAPYCHWSGSKAEAERLPEEILMDELRAAALMPFNQAPSIQTLLARTGQSADHVARRFRRAYGLTPLSYLNRLRIEQAKALWQQEPGIGVIEAAQRLGFTDYRYFSRLMRKVEGQGPRRTGY